MYSPKDMYDNVSSMTSYNSLKLKPLKFPKMRNTCMYIFHDRTLYSSENEQSTTTCSHVDEFHKQYWKKPVMKESIYMILLHKVWHLERAYLFC